MLNLNNQASHPSQFHNEAGVGSSDPPRTFPWLRRLINETSSFAAVVPGKMQRPVNKMAKHKNKWLEMKTMNTRKQLSESGQDYSDSTSPPGDQWILLSLVWQATTAWWRGHE